MTKYIIFNKGQDHLFEAMNHKIHAYKKATVPGYNAERWSRKLISDEDESIAIVIKDGVDEVLTTAEKAKMKNNLPANWRKPINMGQN